MSVVISVDDQKIGWARRGAFGREIAIVRVDLSRDQHDRVRVAVKHDDSTLNRTLSLTTAGCIALLKGLLDTLDDSALHSDSEFMARVQSIQAASDDAREQAHES